MSSVILIILAVQTVCIVVVSIVLWVVLGKRLTNSALKDFSFYAQGENEPQAASVQVITHKTIAPAHRDEIQKIVKNKVGPNAQVVYQVQGDLMGGMIIKINQRVYNYSLRNRLQQGGFLK